MLWLILADVNGEGNYEEPAWFQPLMQISDRYGFIIWPALGILVIGGLAVSMIRAASHKSIPPEDRTRFKKEIVQELRRRLQGLSVEEVSKMIGHPHHLCEELLEEMRKDGMIARAENEHGKTIYRVKV
jgi:hypothetical protein